ncbi:MAG TPA: hypothetical protein VF614_01570 [Chthoniobacteraceae bacterium]|jgi:hypothetical protein
MGLLSRFQSEPAPAVRPAPAAQDKSGFAGSWRRQDFVSYPIGGDLHAIYRKGREPLQLPAFAVDFALSCREFKPLSEHLRKHAERFGWTSSQLDAIREWLPILTREEVLVSGDQVTERCISGLRRSEPPPITMVGFPTGGDRLPLLSRALRSFVANAQTYGRTPEFVISDGSSEPANAAAFSAEAETVREEFGARATYLGEAEKRRLAKDLIRRTGCSPEVLEFALFDPLKIGFTCGANRNALLLHGAGEMICSIDDDVVCNLAVAPDRDERLALYSTCDPFSRHLYSDREAVLRAHQFADVDFLAAHERLLGRDLASVAAPAGEKRELDLALAREDILRRVMEEEPQIRATFAGHLGDPGIPTSVYFLYYQKENRRRLVASEEHYRSVFGSRRVFTSVNSEALGDGSTSPGMAMGLDQRELLPPFFPVLHAEDFIFGATVWKCCPGALLGQLPIAVQHEPASAKPILTPADLNGENRATIFEFAHLVRQMTRHHPLPEHATAAERMQHLGRYFTEQAALPERDFVERLRDEVLHHESEKMIFLDGELQRDDLPDFWREDVERYLVHVQEALQAPDFDIPYDLKGRRSDDENRQLMQKLLGAYGALLNAWPVLFQAAQELRLSQDGARTI